MAPIVEPTMISFLGQFRNWLNRLRNLLYERVAQIDRLQAAVQDAKDKSLSVRDITLTSNVRSLLEQSFQTDNKIQTIRWVRELTGCGLKDAKDLVEGAQAKAKEAVLARETMRHQD